MNYDDGSAVRASTKRATRAMKAKAEINTRKRAPIQARWASVAWAEVSKTVTYAAAPLVIILELQKHVS